MIITCKECSTRFNLDESLLKTGGSKVRCSSCKHVFTAFPPVPDTLFVPEEEIQPPLDPGLDLEIDDFLFEDPDLEIDDSPKTGLEKEKAGAGAADIEISFDSESEPIEFEEDLDFEGEELTFDEGDITFDEPFSETPGKPGLEDFDSGEITSPDLDISFEDDLDAGLVFEETSPEKNLSQALEMETPDDPDMIFQDITGEADPEKVLEDELEPTLSMDEDTTEILDPEPEDLFSSYDRVLEQDIEPEDNFQTPEGDEDTTLEQELPEETQAEEISEEPEHWRESPLIDKSDLEDAESDLSPPQQRKRKSGLGAPIIILILLFLLVAGAYIASLMLGYQVPYLSDVKIPLLEQYLKKEAPIKTDPKPIPNQESVNGRFVSNDTAGELFVITGRIENPAAIPYRYIQVKGILITKGKVETSVQTVFCGNIIAEEILKTGNISDINKQLTVREGTHDSNLTVKPGGSVPFMLVFSNLPDNLENFTVEVIGFEKEDPAQ